MCNDYEQHVRWVEYCKMMQALDLAIPNHQSEADLPQADDVRINDTGPVMRAAGNEIELVPMTFAFPPGRPRGAPVFNFRSEGRHFANSTRCIVPASAFFEFTGTAEAWASSDMDAYRQKAGAQLGTVGSAAGGQDGMNVPPAVVDEGSEIG